MLAATTIGTEGRFVGVKSAFHELDYSSPPALAEDDWRIDDPRTLG